MLLPTLFFILATLQVDSQFACQRDSCAHGVCRPFANDSYECFCENGYTGYHCETDFDDCVTSPCQNEASCVDLVAGVECVCPQGITGSFCESILDHCSSHPCLNGGTCYDLPDGFNCSCGTGFYGQNCEGDIEVCGSLESQQTQCFNGGTCIEGVGISFTCSCVSGFEGPRCETNIDECLSQPCQNNGTCADELDGFVCICSYQWTGIFCEMEQEICDPEVCSNRGLCVGNTTEHVCYCVPDFHGPHCEWRYDECLPKPRCFHGGTCVDGVDAFTCSCHPGFIGKLCEVHCSNNCTDVGGSSSGVWTTKTPPSLATQASFWGSHFATVNLSFHDTDADFDSSATMNSAAQTPDPDPCISGFDCEQSSSSQLDFTRLELFSSYSEFTAQTGSPFQSECSTSEIPDMGSLTTAHDPSWSSWKIGDISPSFLWPDRDLTESPIPPSPGESNWLTSSPLSGHSLLTTTPLLSTSWLEPTEIQSDAILSPSWWPTTRYPASSSEYSPSISDDIFAESTHLYSTLLNLASDRSQDDGATQPASPNSCCALEPSDIDTDQYDPVSFAWTASANDEFSRFYFTSSEDLMWSEVESVSSIIFDASHALSLSLVTDDWKSSQFFGSLSAVFFTPVPVPSMPFFTPIKVSSEPSSVIMTVSPSVKTVLLPSHVIQSMTPVSTSPLISMTTPVPRYEHDYYGCTNVTCKNNGICQPSATDLKTFKCHCRLLFAGPYCERQLNFIEIPSFDGSSYLIHDLKHVANGTGDFWIQATFESFAENGVVFYIDFSPSECLETFLMLETENGMTVLSFSCGSQSVVSMEEGLRVDDGTRHTVAIGMQWYHNEFSQVICNVSMQLDQWPPMTGQQHDVPSLCNVAHLHLGGVHRPWPEVRNDELEGKIGFTGCVIGVAVNNRALNLVPGAADGFNVQECTSVLCASRICQHGANCHNVSGTEIECECPSGFAGQFCERHQCPDNFCQSGGTCLSRRQQHICLCPLGFQGLHCEQESSNVMEKMAFSGSVMGYSSFVAVPVPNYSAPNCFEVKINFVPEDSSQSELLLFLGQNGQHFRDSLFIAVGLKDDSVIVQYNLGTGTDLLSYDGLVRRDRKHHLLTVGFNESQLWMKIDNRQESTVSAVLIINLRCVDQFGTYVYIGGHVAYNFTMLPENLLFSTGFTGCVADIHINDNNVNTLPMDNKTIIGRNIHQCPMVQCSLSCQNGGTCINLETTSMCLCPVGWTGPLCNDLFDPCHSGAHHCSPNSDCILEGQGYRCDCSLGWAGARCDQGLNFSTPYFNGINSFMAFQPRNIRHQLTLRVQFQPLAPNGVLFYAAVQLQDGSSDFACLTLDDGLVEFRYNLGGGRFSTAMLRSRSKIGILDPSWHTVDVWQQGGEAMLGVDGQNVTGHALTAMVTLDAATKFYIGGLPDMDSMAKSASEKLPVPFHGCIRYFSINDVPYSLSAQGPAVGRNIGNCSSPETGSFSKCANGGTCIQVIRGTCQCACVQPFTGPNCLDVLPCHFHICQNGGTCVPIDSTDVQLQYGVPYSCDCLLGWMGQYCDEQTSQIIEARFRGDSYVLVADDSYVLSDRTRNRIALNFSTAFGNGLLLWTGVEPNFDDDYLAIGLENGRLKVAWNLGWFSRSQMLMPLDPTGETLADSKWHTVVLYRQKQKVSIKLDEAIVSATTPGSFTELNTLGVYYIGGLPRGVNFTTLTNGHFHAGFVGCLKNVELSESKQAIDFMGAVSGSNVLQC